MTDPESANPGNPEPQLRPAVATPTPGQPQGWYRRFLPHRDEGRLLQLITYRLADSLPRVLLERLQAELASASPEDQESRRRRQTEQWLDASYGACVLRHPQAAELVVATWQRFHGERYDLVAWVVMPNHVHVLIRVYPAQVLGRIVQSWKSYTGRWITGLVQGGAVGVGAEEGVPRHGAQGAPDETRAGARGSQVWMREYWDRYIRDEKHLVAAIDYIHQNPVSAGLVNRAEDWPWSSASAKREGQ